MNSNDEWIIIQYQYDRIRNYKDIDQELYNYYEQGNTIKVRFVNITLSTGETETIMTNLDNKEFTSDDINYIYQKRWELKQAMLI